MADCPPYSNSPPGSTSARTCTCNAGSTGPIGGPCSQCTAGKFKDASGTDACITCLAGKYGSAGAASESECMVCPAGKFGRREGSSICTDCEAGEVSNRREAACRRVTEALFVVKLILSFPLSRSEFTADKQIKFRESIAAAAGFLGVAGQRLSYNGKPADVTVDRIETWEEHVRRSVGRRLLAQSVLVYTMVKFKAYKDDVGGARPTAADTMVSLLTIDKIHGALENAGLPKATIICVQNGCDYQWEKATTVKDASTSPTGVGGGDISGNTSNQSTATIPTTVHTTTNIPFIIGAVVGGAALFLLSVCYYFKRCQSKHQLTPVQQPQFERAPPELILSEFRVERQGECCICLERKLLSDLLALVPCGHRCVCANHASHVVGRPCPMCRAQTVQAIRVFD